MAVVYERIEGTDLIRAYSNTGHYIVNQQGDVYGEAIDPDFCNRTYTESEEMIPDEEGEEATAEEIMEILLGGEEE